MSRNNGAKPVTPESVYYNPFAEDRQSTTAIDVSFLADSHHRPAIRRRGSGSDSATASSASSSSGLSVFTNAPRQLSIKTDVARGGHHPLRSADLSSGFRNGAGVTRPQLTRIVNIPALVDAPPVPGADMIIAEPAADEKVVLVHEVTSKDSLAGVSLKYGISMAELRRANHLWSSDPIHLRKVLYIPLDKTSRKELDPAPLLVSTAEDAEQAAPSPTHPDTMGPMSTIRRIPASQLSFFPPPARPQEPDPLPAEMPARTKHPHSRHTRYATTPASSSPLPGTAGSPSLTSILSALPIQPSTRDTIIARLSYDSTGSSSHSEHDYEGHELDDVRRGASLDSIFPSSEATPKARAAPSGAFARSHARTASASSVYGGGGGPQYRRVGPPRTVQLEPSPRHAASVRYAAPQGGGSLTPAWSSSWGLQLDCVGDCPLISCAIGGRYALLALEAVLIKECSEVRHKVQLLDPLDAYFRLIPTIAVILCINLTYGLATRSHFLDMWIRVSRSQVYQRARAHVLLVPGTSSSFDPQPSPSLVAARLRADRSPSAAHEAAPVGFVRVAVLRHSSRPPQLLPPVYPPNGFAQQHPFPFYCRSPDVLSLRVRGFLDPNFVYHTYCET
ncbi:Peptidoglycan-binding domain-containing protein 1 [Mycena venus]|uniref:Peptidoglycan-binding domain-containing protein 1 n=1 Tax=Mycena venus TaxID=2733690 RepID=A0A8H7D1A5_9AGAR|nr:Peptidoglycan-binding domain-containing protein 1 [Mycena venus]